MTMSEVEIIENPTEEQKQQEIVLEEALPATQPIEQPQLEQQQDVQQTPKPFRRQPQQQFSKDKTLFCINIDQRCTEDILFELFLQAGPIENIIRKPDRNGNIIALITYKHIESLEYAIKLFDKILLYGQRLKVQLSQANTKTVSDTSVMASTPPASNSSPNLVSGYSKPYSRTQSYDNVSNSRQREHQQREHQQREREHHQAPQQQMHPPFIPPQFMQGSGPLGMPFNLLQFMTQPLIPFNNDPQQHRQHHNNQSTSPNSRHHDHNSRNQQMRHRQHHHNDQQHDYQRHRSRDYSNSHQQQPDGRSRSPRDRHRRR